MRFANTYLEFLSSYIVHKLFSAHSLHNLNRVAAMDNNQLLSIESFSYSWLINLKPSVESLENSLRVSIDAFDEASFIEMDPRMPPSKRFLRHSYDFNFDFPVSESPLSLVHADELFSNGLITPFFLDPLKMVDYDGHTIPASPTSSHVSETLFSARKIRCSSLKRCRRISKQFLQKYLDFLRPLYKKLRGCGRLGSRAEAVLGSRIQAVCSPESSPRMSATDDWRRSCDSESSIHEAVLHCKRSIGK